MAARRKNDSLPYDMFDLAQQAYEARKATLLANVYHKAQERAWSGKEILPLMIAKHGKPSLPKKEREALARIFAIILWGELAAWKISAQLADSLEPLEAKMAATSQAFDEARHFYTMYDYLQSLGYLPERIDRLSERVLDYTLNAKKLSHKICGMQLMIETIALTIFQTVRKSGIEPVLGEVLRYFEIDEARHVALGVNYLPAMIRKMSRLELVEFMYFQFKLMIWVVHSLRALKPDLQTLGIDPRAIVELGKAKQYEVFREMWGDLGVDIKEERSVISRFFDAIDEVYFPRDESTSTLERLRKAANVFVARYSVVDAASQEEAHEQLHSDTVLPGMGPSSLGESKRRIH
ncbi:MAG: ferritin-like domain-containing protein [Myxococcales bacterium]|nr:ferritin-like domain-containing protein [Myxococcales bacterium]